MHISSNNILVFLGTKYNTPISYIEQNLPRYLSNYYKVFCFEYPRFLNLLNILRNKIPLVEYKSNNLIIYHSFGILPLGRTFVIINFINHFINYLLFRILFKKYFLKIRIITFTPEFLFISIFIKNIYTIYHAVDDYSFMPWWSNFFQRMQVNALEKYLLRKVNKIVVVSGTLYKKFAKLHNNVVLFPTPSETDIYLQYKDNPKNIPSDIRNVTKPIIGFIGTIRDYNLDIDLLRKLFRRFSIFSFVFLGVLDNKSKKTGRLIYNTSNCYYLGCKNISQLSSYLAYFDVCIIPYRLNSYGQSAYPVKIMEYLAMGKPVVTSALPSIQYLSDEKLIYWARSDNEFTKYLSKAIREKGDLKLVQKRKEKARENDWNNKIKEVIKLLEI